VIPSRCQMMKCNGVTESRDSVTQK